MLEIICQNERGGVLGTEQLVWRVLKIETFGELKTVLRPICTFYHYNVEYDFVKGEVLISDSDEIAETESIIARRRTALPMPSDLLIDHIVKEEIDCGICLETITANAAKSFCGHVFHRTCLAEWISHNSICPLCRRQI
jgi:hypothetical protein